MWIKTKARRHLYSSLRRGGSLETEPNQPQRRILGRDII